MIYYKTFFLMNFDVSKHFLGSGGAIIGLLHDDNKFEELRDELQRSMGSIVVEVIPNEF